MMNSDNRPPGSVAGEYIRTMESLPIPGTVDWRKSPTAFKHYTDGPRIGLGYDSGHTARETTTSTQALEPGQLGQLLSDAYGVTRQRWTAPDALWRILGSRKSTPPGHVGVAAGTLRPVASGGARFPGELYVVSGAGENIAAGVHHYDPAHHALVTVRYGDCTAQLADALGEPERSPSLTLLLSIFFWKNAFKYGELCYRLCSLDAGALAGQILAVAERYTLRAQLRYRFADEELNDLAQLDSSRESIFAAIEIDEGNSPSGAQQQQPVNMSACATQIPRTGNSASEETWSVDSFPLVARLHRASQLHYVESVPHPTTNTAFEMKGKGTQQSVALPECDVALLDGVRHRRSSNGYFRPHTLGLNNLAALLGAATRSYDSDLHSSTRRIKQTTLFCAINSVAAVSSGIYYYDSDRHLLRQIYVADIREELQNTLMAGLFNLAHTSVCIYPVGNYDAGFDIHGDRWYRMQNIEAGIMAQRLYLASAALGLECRANLGYSVARTDSLLGLVPGSLTSLLQLMIGKGREPGHYYEHPCAY